jgi:hypothetical protein
VIDSEADRWWHKFTVKDSSWKGWQPGLWIGNQLLMCLDISRSPHLLPFFFFLAVLGTEVRVLDSTTWATSPSPMFCFQFVFQIGSDTMPRLAWEHNPPTLPHEYLGLEACTIPGFWDKSTPNFAWAALRLRSSYLHLLNSWDYRRASTCPVRYESLVNT